jgi:hypothetical protein
MSDDPQNTETDDEALSDREDGGPTSTGEKQGDEVEGGHGDRPSGFDPHE